MSKIVINSNEILEIYTDGASRGNPGPAASSFILIQGENIIYKDSRYIGNNTNNVAEYHAVINALKAIKTKFTGEVHIFSDSNLLVQQVNKKWKVNYPHLRKLRDQIHGLCKDYQKVKFFHVGRENRFIQLCDQLCNQKLDMEGFN